MSPDDGFSTREWKDQYAVKDANVMSRDKVIIKTEMLENPPLKLKYAVD